MAGFKHDSSRDRLRANLQLLQLSIDTTTTYERARYIYHVSMLELYVWRIKRISRRSTKHASWLDDNLEIIKLRRELTHL